MEQPNTNKKKGFSRRKFLARSGAAIMGSVALLYFGRSKIRSVLSNVAADVKFDAGITDFDPTVWFEVNADNTITLKSPKMEMGQGVFTGFAILAAEELDVPVDIIKVVHASTLTGPQSTAGTGLSNSTSSLYTPIREVAATLRETLKLAASKLWTVPPTDIQTANGVITAGSHSVSYAEIAQQTKTWEIAKTPALRQASTFKYIGKEHKRVDLEDKILGKTVYGIDTDIPGMVYGAVLYCPYFGGEVKTADITLAKNNPSVLSIIQDKHWIGVVAKTRYAAEKAIASIKVGWTFEPNYTTQDAIDAITVGQGVAVVMQEEGNTADELTGDVLASEYRTPIGFHATMEPSIVVADASGENLKLYTSTQNIAFMRQSIVDQTDFKEENIQIIPAFLGGGFGRRGYKHNALEAIKLSKAVGKPVHLLYTRQQEFQNGYVRPNTHHIMSGNLDANSKILAIQHEFATGSMAFLGLPMVKPIIGADFMVAGHGGRFSYTIPNRRTKIWHSDLPFQTGLWRGVGMFANTFAIESFMDELASKAGANPLEFRLDHCGNTALLQRRKNLLLKLGEKAGWNKPKAEATGRGLAVCEDHGTISAAIVELQLIDKKIKVLRVVQAIDAGTIVNPTGVKQQVEGATMMAISASLYEEATIENSQFTQTSFHTYQVATLTDTPEIEVIIQESSEPPSGVGEPPLSPVAPAIANAIHNLTGLRLRTLPLQAALDKQYQKTGK
ncbi:xanthine dehydrogenase family protein molybdopterin-binding subunit [Spirosoma sp. KNUC1025]|uniref:xanthine dehydrogenase family protein molybdopterin-binding subunit n=1 Tax=Spirosoma sp. KNUC1025 TaxID=2894082 RepID=UPI001E352B2E|nr:molybdopterin cofactor-binding domain-containing protein [Spirosoma sp. KNUC1025]UFH57794.1 molybdopterin-dependent oxidoreductase [Spirosoma sp. KNUC1025]